MVPIQCQYCFILSFNLDVEAPLSRVEDISERSGFLTEVVQLIWANLRFDCVHISFWADALRFSLLCLASWPPAPISGVSVPIGLKEGSGKNWERSEKPRHFSFPLWCGSVLPRVQLPPSDPEL